MKNRIEFIENAGGCIVSNNILSEKGRVTWCIREQPLEAVDNGWRFLSDIDTDEFLNDSKNMSVCDYNTIAELEPAILGIYHFPIGTELTLERENGKIFFVNSITGEKVNF